MDNIFLSKENCLVERLKRETRPVVVYGMGNGADKIFELCAKHGIKISDIYASDEFVRGHTFRGIRVKKYSEVCELYDDFVILLAFAVFRDDLMEKVDKMSKEHTLLVPDVPLFGSAVFDYGFFEANRESIFAAYELMSDETSKRVYADIVNAKLMGSYELLRRCETDREQRKHSALR